MYKTNTFGETRPIIITIIIVIIIILLIKTDPSKPQSVCDSVSNSCGITSTNRNEIVDMYYIIYVPQCRRRHHLRLFDSIIRIHIERYRALKLHYLRAFCMLYFLYCINYKLNPYNVVSLSTRNGQNRPVEFNCTQLRWIL